MRELTRRKAGGDLADQLICDHALFHLEADLRWLELTAARLDELADGRCADDRHRSLLHADDLRKAFGATAALDGASLRDRAPARWSP